MKILIGYDGSECAEAAITDLKRAGLPNDADVCVFTAVDVFLPPKTDIKDKIREDSLAGYVPHGVKLAQQRARHSFEEAKILAERGGEKVADMFPGWTVEAEAVADTPHWAIIAKTEQWNPDLVVVGSHGRTALGRAILGSVSQKVLYETKCSVRIARGKNEKPESAPVKLVLGADGSPDADRMIAEVASRNWGDKTKVKLVTAVERLVPQDEDSDARFNRARDMQMIAADVLVGAGLYVEEIFTEEDPKYFLVREAERWDADAIFLGAKGHRFMERFLMGSVSSSVAARADCTVEVVRTLQI